MHFPLPHLLGALRVFVVVSSLFAAPFRAHGIDVRSLGVIGDGKADDTAAIQAALDSGKTTLEFPAGEFRFGAITIPADSNLSFDPRARITPIREKLAHRKEIVGDDGKTRTVAGKHPLFTIAGDRVKLSGLRFDFCAAATPEDPTPVEILVYAEEAANLVVSGFHVEKSVTPEPPGEGEKRKRLPKTYLLFTDKCRQIVLENSEAHRVAHMIWTNESANVTVRGNTMIGGAAMTTFANGSENLRHHDNWSRNVGYQCVWRGGSPDPSRKAPRVPHGTANVVHRLIKPGDPGYVPHTHGAFDVLVQNNYAEYGTVLCWGNKGRQIVVDGNIARFMWDYAYGSEGDENTIFSNNISVNSAVGGFTCLYWGEKVLITGNAVIVRHEPFQPGLTRHAESTYMGQFIRIHHGPPNPEDKYGLGSMVISGNLFVNELADRPSGISIEAGRDVLFTHNKMINGVIRKAEEVRAKPPEGKTDVDEFASQQLMQSASGETLVMRRLIGADVSRVTITGNEFISRQPGDKPMVLIDGSVSSAIVKDNVFRKEKSHLRFTEAQRELEKALPRYMLYVQDHPEKREYTNSQPATAIGIMPITPGLSVVQGNVITGWKKAITMENASGKGRSVFVLKGNITDGAISVDGPDDRTQKRIEDHTALPAGILP